MIPKDSRLGKRSKIVFFVKKRLMTEYVHKYLF